MKIIKILVAICTAFYIQTSAQIKNIQYSGYETIFENINVNKKINLNFDKAIIGNNTIFIPNIKSADRSDMIFSIDKSTLKRKGYYTFKHEKVIYQIIDFAFDSASNKLFALYVEKVKTGELIVSLNVFTESMELILKRNISILNKYGNKIYLYSKDNNLLLVYPEMDNDKNIQVRYELYDSNLNKIQSNIVNIPLKGVYSEFGRPDFDFLSNSFDDQGNFYGLINAITNDKRKFQRNFPLLLKINISKNDAKIVDLSSKIDDYSLQALFMSKIINGKTKIVGLAGNIGNDGKVNNLTRLFLMKLDLTNENIDFFQVFKVNQSQIDKSANVNESFFVDYQSNPNEVFFNSYILESVNYGKSTILFYTYWNFNENGDRIIMTSIDKNGLLSYISINDNKIEYIKLFSTYIKKTHPEYFTKLSPLIIDNKLFAFHLIPYDVSEYKFDNKEINKNNILQALKYFYVNIETGDIKVKADYLKNENNMPISISYLGFPNKICFNAKEKEIYIYLMSMKINKNKILPASSSSPKLKDSYFGKISF